MYADYNIFLPETIMEHQQEQQQLWDFLVNHWCIIFSECILILPPTNCVPG
jgi:hypothetical protein